MKAESTPNPTRSQHLHYCIMTAVMECNENRHPQKVMKELGITYQYAVPRSVFDSWEFWNCENVPEELPEFITIRKLDPMEHIGLGLSKEDAEKIKNYNNNNSEE